MTVVLFNFFFSHGSSPDYFAHGPSPGSFKFSSLIRKKCVLLLVFPSLPWSFISLFPTSSMRRPELERLRLQQVRPIAQLQPFHLSKSFKCNTNPTLPFRQLSRLVRYQFDRLCLLHLYVDHRLQFPAYLQLTLLNFRKSSLLGSP